MQGRNKNRKKDFIPKRLDSDFTGKMWLLPIGWQKKKKKKIWIALNQSQSAVAGQKYPPRVQADGYWCMKCWKSVVSGFCIGQTAVR